MLLNHFPYGPKLDEPLICQPFQANFGRLGQPHSVVRTLAPLKRNSCSNWLRFALALFAYCGSSREHNYSPVGLGFVIQPIAGEA